MGNSQNGLQVIERERGGDDSTKSLQRILVLNYNTMLPCYEAMPADQKEQFRAALGNIDEEEMKRSSNAITGALSMIDEEDAIALH